MAKQVVDRWTPTSVAELRDALDEMMQSAREDGAESETVYVCVRDLALVRETLTDGSVVFNVVIRENR
ncbi:hypothetical protein [Sphingomonas sp. 3-13AW]|uniref:hypothetical protein n=1 Tax=Sphingomonas sp. 3-13AW TaxID=3050450 RepID=UPI003BB7944A